MTANRILALIALAAYLVFFGVILVKVPRIDLTIAILIGVALTGYDLWTQIGPGRRAD